MINTTGERRAFIPRYGDAADCQVYPELETPQSVQAQAQRRPGEGLHVALCYCGRDVVTLEAPRRDGIVFRQHSDGSVQSAPFIQQFYLCSAEPVCAVITLHMRGDALCMASGWEGAALLGQCGRPLLPGVAGFYGLWEDLLIEWQGAEWSWLDKEARREADGSTTARFEVTVTGRPATFLLRPRYYGEHLGYTYHRPWERRPDTRPIAGWCSWEAYGQGVTEKNIVDAAEAMEAFTPYGLRYVQIDDGFQQPQVPPRADAPVWEAWTETNGKFPGGHDKLTQSIRERGLIPGVWTNAVVTNPDAAVLCLRDKDGEPVQGDWIQFVLDCTPETLERQVLPYYQGLREKGYDYFKTDAVRHLFFDGLQEGVRRGLLTGEEASRRYRAFFECARRGIGDDAYLLSCWGGLTQAIGVCDGCRVATDASASWFSVLLQVTETARWWFSQRILFTVDPDHVCARMELEWARMLLTVVSLTGGVYMLSDPPDQYDAARQEIIRRTLPPVETFTALTGPVDYTLPAFCRPARRDLPPEELSALMVQEMPGTLWAIHFCQEGRRWCVAVRAAIRPLESGALLLEDLGLDPKQEYAVYDFWAERFLGRVQGTWNADALGLGYVQAVALTPIDSGSPLLIGSTRHVSMDAVSVRKVETLNGKTRLSLQGAAGQVWDYWLLQCQSVSAGEGCQTSLRRDGEAACVTVRFQAQDAMVELCSASE